MFPSNYWPISLQTFKTKFLKIFACFNINLFSFLSVSICMAYIFPFYYFQSFCFLIFLDVSFERTHSCFLTQFGNLCF